MPFFGKRDSSRSTKIIAIIDIGSASVGCALVRLNKEGPPEALEHLRIEIPVSASRESEELARRTIKSLQEALHELKIKNNDYAPEHTAVFLPSPWSSLFLRNIRLTPRKEFRVNSGVLERMVQQSLEQAHPLQKTEEVVEHSALGIRLNGYAVADLPKDMLVQSAELTLVSVTSPHSFLTEIRQELQKELGIHMPITFHSTSVAASYALSVLTPEIRDYLLCNSEGEIAECLLIADHAPTASATAPVGCNTILRTLRTHADMARAEASSALALARNSSSPMAAKLKGTLDAAKRECAEGFYTAAKEILQNASTAPQTVYVLGEGSEGQWFADSIANSSSLKKLFPASVAIKTPTAIMFQAQMKGVPMDIFLCLESLFTDARFDAGLTFNFKLNK